MRLGTLVLVTFALSGIVRAGTITETITGAIATAFDPAGIFGPVNGNLSGDSITATFTYDPALLAVDSTYVLISTGEEYSDSVFDSAVSASVTIESHDFTVADSDHSDISETNNTSDFHVGVSAEDSVQNGIEVSLFTTIAWPPVGQITDQAAMDRIVSNSAALQSVDQIIVSTGGVSDIINFTLSSPTPEPSTWFSLALSLCATAMLGRRASLRN